MKSVLTALTLCGLLLAPVAAADAAKPEDVFGGKVMLSDKAFPLEAKSAKAYIAQVKKQSKDRFQEDKEKKQWKIYYAAFFKKPLNDLEVKVTLYDITDGGQKYLDSWEEYLSERKQRVIIGNLKLKRKDGKIDPNSRLMIVMEDRGKIIASAKFYILGEKKKYSGKVEFTDEETKEGSGDGDEEQEEQDDDDDQDKKGDDKATEKKKQAPPPAKKK